MMKRLLSKVVAFALAVFVGAVSAATEPVRALDNLNVDNLVSAAQSFVAVTPSVITADGKQVGLVLVTVKSLSGKTLAGKNVVLSSSLAGVTITPATATTDANGVASFTVSSVGVGGAILTASADGVTMVTKPVVQFILPLTCPFAVGSLVKLPDDGNPDTQFDSAVYFYGKDCRRHAFPNEKAYFSWYPDFSSVVIVNASPLASMPLGKNVAYKPGVRMVKFVTLNNVYAVAQGGVLRWVKTESVAQALYGADWNKKIDDISDAFFTNYAFGADINSASDYSISHEFILTQTINDNL